jgi:hypothetical protein
MRVLTLRRAQGDIRKQNEMQEMASQSTGLFRYPFLISLALNDAGYRELARFFTGFLYDQND